MMMQEFESRTGFYPSLNLYSFIEKAYMASNLDKDAFCKAYKNNESGIAESIARKASNVAILKTHNSNEAVNKKIAGLEQEVEMLKAHLNRELEWQPYEMEQNIKQADYAKLANGAESGQCCHYMTDEEAIRWICEEFDFDPAKVTILHEIDEVEINRHRQIRKTGKKIDRRPVYCATDYNYIRFNTRNWNYEVWNDTLRPFYD